MTSSKSTSQAGTHAVETAMRPTHPMISNQPERFGALSAAFLFVEEKRLHDLIAKARNIGIWVALVLSIPIIFRLCQVDHVEGMLMDVTKIIFSYVLFGSIGALGAIFVYRHKIMQLLFELEEVAMLSKEMAHFYMPYARDELKGLNKKLNKHKEEPTVPSGFELAKEFWPVLSLFLKKEQNLLRWGMAGAKAVQTMIQFINGQNNGHGGTSTDTSGDRRE